MRSDELSSTVKRWINDQTPPNQSKYFQQFFYKNDSSNGLIDKLQQLNFNQKHQLVGFDVTSLSTNVPFHETIDIITEKVLYTRTKLAYHQLEKNTSQNYWA